jgi:hypothetical protein
VLKVFEAAELPAQVKLQRGRLEVTVPQRDPALVRKALDIWYRKHAREVFQRRIATCSEGLRWLRLPPRPAAAEDAHPVGQLLTEG